MPQFLDSIGKIKGYIESASMDTVQLSKNFFRDYSCPPKCGGCCPRFSLDYFEGSQRWEDFKKQYPDQVKHFTRREVDGVAIWSDLQKDHDDYHCKHLNKEDGRCGIHKANPFSCEFELNKFITFKEKKKSILINKLFGRGWNLKRIDGERGALCEMLPYKHEKTVRDVELLEELEWISDRFGVVTKLTPITKFIRENIETIRENEGIKEDGIQFTNKNIEGND